MSLKDRRELVDRTSELSLDTQCMLLSIHRSGLYYIPCSESEENLARRQFSAYCGLGPYPHQSGTSINGRKKIHSISDRKMKSLLSMSAISAIQHDTELKTYYKKRVEEGKQKMVALNINRNKIVSLIFATVKRGTPFVELSPIAA